MTTKLRFSLIPLAGLLALGSQGCSPSPTQTATKAKQAEKVQITNFYSSGVEKGGTGNLCYGVTGATKVTLDPPVEEVWPAVTKCVQIRGDGPKHYTLTAMGADGQSVSQSIDIEPVEVVAAPRLYDIWINSLDIKQGELIKLCFKAQNAVSREASPGKYDATTGCLVDYPKVATTYNIAAIAKDGQRDTRGIAVKVR
jgi:hypothetical protein